MPNISEKSSPRASERFLAYSAQHARRRCLVKFFWVLVVALLVATAFLIWTSWRLTRSAQGAEIKYAWVQMLPEGSDNGRLARAIVANSDQCPTITVGEASWRMDYRPAPARAAFPILLCEARIDSHSPARIGFVTLPSRQDDPTHIVAIGDTGCRMVHWTSQPCFSGEQWPFAAIASNAAKAIGEARLPSVIIHVGDYHYREHVCLDGNPDCGGSPYGDNWATWEEEFFKPARPLLLAAPWVLLRGNHEDCNRAGAGWSFFFALPNPAGKEPTKACESELGGYSVAIGYTADHNRRSLFVFDTAAEADSHGIVARCETFIKWFGQLEVSKAENWLALHQPLWPRNSDGSPSDLEAPKAPCTDATKSALDAIRTRFDTAKPQRLARLVLAGDTHLFQFFRPDNDNFPVQLVVGNGGTSLDKLKKSGVAEIVASASDTPITSYGVMGSSLSVARHGYTTLRRDEWIWTVQAHDIRGKSFVTCHVKEGPDETSPEMRPCSVPPEEKAVSATSG
jgi:hypothetical protein